MIRTAVITAMLACISTLASAEKPTFGDVESTIINSIDDAMPQAIEELERVVNINSGTMNFAGVREVGSVFQPWFENLGFTVTWADGASFNRAGHLLATRLSEQPNALRILLIGHLDTVFSTEDPFQTFAAIDDRYTSGPGITDMKGGNMIMLQALRGLEAAQQLDRVSIKVVLTGDEESSGEPLSASKYDLIEAAKWADIALGFEDGDSDIKTAVIARRGALTWRLSVSARSAHSSQIFQPEVGSGAIFEVARILNAFREQLQGHGDLTFNPALIVGGTRIEPSDQPEKKTAFGKSNVIPQTVEVTGGLRALTPDELSHAKQTMQAIVQDNLPHTSAELVIDEGYPPLAPTDGNRALLATYSEVSQALGYGPVIAVNPRNAGAADISFTAGHVDGALDGLGLMGSGGHTRDEQADMSSFAKNAHKAALLIYRLVENHDR